MEENIKQIFSRQYKRMEAELRDINIPNGYLTIISKYWNFCEQDLQKEIGNGNAYIQERL